MTSAQIHLARRRLGLGVSNVGFWVLAACVGLYWLSQFGTDAPTYALTDAPTGAPSGAPSTMHLLGIGASAIAAQAVFDFIGGVTFMPEPRPSVMTFLRGWLRGALGHTLVLAGVGFVSAVSLHLTGGFSAGIVLATTALALGRVYVLRALGGAAVNDSAFTGGVVGLGRRAKSLLPASWVNTVPPAELDAEASRRRWQIANGLPFRAFLLIVLWNLIGATIGTFAFDLADRSIAVALFGFGCWMTLWTFASLLVLPALSQKAVYAADRAAADAGHDPRAWITRFADLVGEDGSAKPGVQTIFYPIPATTLRLQQLERPTSGLVLGNLARSNLYYSWATFTLLGRAVHCNVGRPVLWVFPPAA